MLERTRGIVLHMLRYDDDHIIADIFTESRGSVSFLVRMPRSHRSKVRSVLLRPLNILELDFDYRPQHGLQRIREMRVAMPYVSLPYHPVKCALALFLVTASSALMAQDKVLLIKAESAQLLDIDGESYRKVTGPAKFLHNDTYLLCDTAYWNINTNIIDAMGHVRIIQDRTTLSSNTLQYVVDQDLAKFRGDLVQLVDQDKNTLRTKYLDYNTKDSVAVFQDGGAMRDKDGQVIESLYGTYDSKAKLFVFNDQVNMYMDTTFVKTSRLEYRSDLSTAYFGYGTDMWQDDKMLSANDGWYDRGREVFFFRDKVHLLTDTQEAWSDSLYFYRKSNNLKK